MSVRPPLKKKKKKKKACHDIFAVDRSHNVMDTEQWNRDMLVLLIDQDAI